MATEKILIFDEAGNAKRMKVRIARFLDNEPVTASDKENIRTTLDVDGSQSGTFTTPLSVTSASDSSFTGGGKVGVGGSPSYDLHVTNASTAASIGITGTGGSKDTWTVTSSDAGGKALLNFTDEDTANTVMRLHQDGKVGIGGSPGYELDVQAANARIAATSGAGVVNHLQADATGAWVGPLSNHNLYFKTNNSTRWTIHSSNGNLIASSGVGIDFGAVASGTGTVTPTTGGLLDDYETGTWAGTYAPQTGTFTTMTVDTDLVYTKVGNLVHVSGFIRTDDVDVTGGSNGLKITGLPFTCAKPSAVSIGFAWNWGTAAPLVGYIGASGDAIWLQTRTGTTARTDGFNVSNMSTGTSADRNILYLEATYQAS